MATPAAKVDFFQLFLIVFRIDITRAIFYVVESIFCALFYFKKTYFLVENQDV